MKRWGHMARVFTKIGKEIEMAVKASGPDPSSNLRLRLLIQNAKAENMPKENVERAIKRATDKDAADYKEMIYEGYGPHGIGGDRYRQHQPHRSICAYVLQQVWRCSRHIRLCRLHVRAQVRI